MIAIVDFSCLIHRLYHANREEAAYKAVSMVRALPEDRVVIAIDSPPYKRKEINPAYKANRDVPDPELIGQIREAIEELANLGFEIASCPGWEADDVIGSLLGGNTPGCATVYGSDKDLLQVTDLVDPFTREVKTAEGYLGVKREQVVDYLCLVGDTSDNVDGVKGIGAKTAVKMLSDLGSLSGILEAVREQPDLFRPKTKEAIEDALAWIDNTRELVTIRTDLDVEITKREPQVAELIDEEPDEPPKLNGAAPKFLAKVEPVEFRHSLEPIGIEQAFRFSQMAYVSGLYPKFKGPEQTMMAVMRGRAFGLDATTALDSIEMIQGKPTMKSSLIAGLILANPKCEFLECIYFGDDKSTWETKRRGGRNVIARTFTIEEADRLGLTSKDNWKKQPGVMLQWRCVTALARQVYPDIMLGIYGSEELQ